MRASVPANHPLRRLFGELVYRAYFVDIEMADPAVVEYVSDLLCRFVHVDNIYRLRNARGARIEQVADMLVEGRLASGEQVQSPHREVNRHIGDFILFWLGVYPESLRRVRWASQKDSLLDYVDWGRRCYYIASTYEEEPYRREAQVLRKLSREFELCAYGLNLVRQRWERLHPGSLNSVRDALEN